MSLGVHIRTLKILIRSVEPVPESQKAKASVKPVIIVIDKFTFQSTYETFRIASGDGSRGIHWST